MHSQKSAAPEFLFEKINIIGLGLIGGSLARACKKYHASKHIFGFDVSKGQTDFAIENQIIDGVYNFDQSNANDLIIICAPLSAYFEIFKKIAPIIGDKTLIIDIGSLKNQTLKLAEEFLEEKAKNFVPCHPIAGSEKSGVINSDEDLFFGKKTILTPSKISDKNYIKKAELFWQKIGSDVNFIDAKEHDKIFALVSHLPQFLSFIAYENFENAKNNDNDEILNKHFRLQNSNPKIWQEIFSLNRQNIEYYLGFYLKNIDELISSKLNFHKAKSACNDIIIRRFFLVHCFLNLPNIEEFKIQAGSGFKDFTAIASYGKFLSENPQILENNQESLIQFLNQIKSKILNYEFS